MSAPLPQSLTDRIRITETPATARTAHQWPDRLPAGFWPCRRCGCDPRGFAAARPCPGNDLAGLTVAIAAGRVDDVELSAAWPLVSPLVQREPGMVHEAARRLVLHRRTRGAAA